MSNLKYNIKEEIENGILTDEFKTKEVTDLNSDGKHCIVNGQRYRKDSIRQILANHSVGPGIRKGESVKRGQAILFVKLGRGRYSLFEGDGVDPCEETEQFQGEPGTDGMEQNAVEKRGGQGSTYREAAKNGIAEKFVEYLREKPYRICINTNKKVRWRPCKGPVHGWQNRLNEYEWGNKKWDETKRVLDCFISELQDLRRDQGNDVNCQQRQAKILYDEIRAWGNPKGTPRNGEFVLSRLQELWNGTITVVDSTLTKLYAFALPQDYVILDSRVATAILSIAEDIFRYRTIEGRRVETVNTQFHGYYNALGVYNGAGGTRPRGFRWSGWPNCYRNIDAQMDANDLCNRIVSRLNDEIENGRKNWTIREVEAVLFMEGY